MGKLDSSVAEPRGAGLRPAMPASSRAFFPEVGRTPSSARDPLVAHLLSRRILPRDRELRERFGSHLTPENAGTDAGMAGRRPALRRIGCSFARLALLLLAVPFLAPAEIIDRIAVSAGPRVITASDIDREIRVVAFLAGGPADFSPAARRATAERMVEQRLIERELEVSRYPVPSASEVAPVLDKFKREHFPTDAAWRGGLAEQGISEQEVKDEMLWVRTLMFFTDSRFGSGVQVSDEEIRDYFEKTVRPAAEAARPGQRAVLDDYRDQIEKTLAGERVDRELDKWLAEARARTAIVYHDEAFQ